MAEVHLRTWTLNTVSTAPLESWEAAARRLRDVLDAISHQVEIAYGQSVTWISQGMDAAAWADVERIAAEMKSLINTDERGVVWEELGARGTVQGYLDGRSLIGMMWHARHDEKPMQCITDFRTTAKRGAARPLADHDPDWLADLVLDTAAAMVKVYYAHITTDAWLDVVIDRKIRDGDVGAVTYSPHPVDPSALPDTLRVARQTPAGTAIVVKDLHRFACDPASLLDDLLALERQITAAAPS